MATFYKTLTPEQQTKFQDMVHHGMGMGMDGMGMHGHDGPGGPPPGFF
jgi:Spy/CpxP family protein refolding chaperone